METCLLLSLNILKERTDRKQQREREKKNVYCNYIRLATLFLFLFGQQITN